MAHRTAKSTTRRPTKTAPRGQLWRGWRGPYNKAPLPKFKVFSELPGAVFIGRVNDDDLRYAKLMQAIRQAYESSDCQASLWHALTEIGLGPDEIERAVLNPATLTDCMYGMPLGGISPRAAIVAKSLVAD